MTGFKVISFDDGSGPGDPHFRERVRDVHRGLIYSIDSRDPINVKNTRLLAIADKYSIGISKILTNDD